MDPIRLVTRTTRMRRRCLRLLALGALVACVATPGALAKYRLTMALGDSTPHVGSRVTVVVHTERALPADDFIRLIAVAPGKGWYDVVGTVTGDSSLARAQIPRDGFEVRLVRVAAKRWRAFVQFPRPGRWRLVVPNETKVGFMIPPPLMRWVRVTAS
jgi:hypothetical protein